MHKKRLQKIAAILAVGLSGLVIIVAASLFVPLDREIFTQSKVTSLRILDRHGTLLREVLSSDEGRGRWCSLDEISPNVINAVLAAEDSRFYTHFGVDPLALTRAASQNLRVGRIVSGGSTISMQVIRNIFHPQRTFPEKMKEMWYALRLERMMSKEEILSQYLNRVPFGNQTFGIDAASRLYFGKPARQLSLAESAFLVAIPNSPSLNDPYRRFGRVIRRQQYVLSRMVEEGFIGDEEYDRAVHEPLVLISRSGQFKAPHFTSIILERIPKREIEHLSEIRTTLDYNVQKTVQLLLQSHLVRLKKHNVTNGAAVVIDNVNHTLLALVGSKDFFDSLSSGQVNGALALRQPGSTLKPFTYGLALESGMTASTLLADIPRVGANANVDFLPENYDKRYHGPVRLRTALACSYNVPAVRTVEQFGEERLLQKLHSAGFASLRQPASYYGVGLTLGNGEVTLLELANAYSTLANLGEFNPLRMVDSVVGSRGRQALPVKFGYALHRGESGSEDSVVHDFSPAPRRVFSEQVAFILTDILSDAEARAPAFGVSSSLSLPFPCATKTGTSKDYRDNWTVGYTPRYTVAVWVGNFNAKPMKLVSGITGAAPLFRDIMIALSTSGNVGSGHLDFTQPDGLTKISVCPRSGMLVNKSCPGEMQELFVEGTQPGSACTVHQVFRLDRRSGLLASRSTPREYVEERVFEIFPPMFARWAEQEGIPLPPVGVSVVSAKHDLPLAINSPSAGDVFKLDPVLRAEYQTISVESLVSSGVVDVSLWMNGNRISALEPPYRYRLALSTLRKGTHTLMLKGRKGEAIINSPPVQVFVQ